MVAACVELAFETAFTGSVLEEAVASLNPEERTKFLAEKTQVRRGNSTSQSFSTPRAVGTERSERFRAAELCAHWWSN
jgi:hypothetical protein